MTIFVAMAWLTTVAFFLIGTTKKYFGVFHLIVISHLIMFILRPVLSYLNDGYILYPRISSSVSYGQVYLTAFIFYAAGLSGYAIRYLTEPARAPATPPSPPRAPHPGYTLIPIGVIVACIGLLFAIGGTSWLSIYRTQAASMVVPVFRYIYPIIMTAIFCLLFVSLFEYAFRRRWITYASLFIFTFATCGLTYTRGQLVFALMLSAAMWLRYKKLTLSFVICSTAALYSVVFVLRPALSHIMFGESLRPHPDGSWLESRFLYSSSGDTIDSWMVVVDYVQRHGLLLGETIVALPLMLMPLTWREAAGVLTAVDILNQFYYGNMYYLSSFGFSLDIWQELFLNFGYMGILAAGPAGYMTRVFEFKLMEITTITLLSVASKHLYSWLLLFTLNFSQLRWVLFAFGLYLAALLYDRLTSARSRTGSSGAGRASHESHELGVGSSH